MRSVPVRVRLDQYSTPEPNTGCVLWLAAITPTGYGRIRVGQKVHQAHRVSYELAHGPIPDDLVIDHLCRVRCCINPDHLEAVTQAVNVRRGAGSSTETNCLHGHAWTPENSMFVVQRRRGNPIQVRICRACHNQRSREYSKRIYAGRKRAA